jgi:hypothetical protein
MIIDLWPPTHLRAVPEYEGDGDPQRWREHCLDVLAELVIAPIRFERFEDRSVPAVKVWGLDRQGGRCYYRHQYSVNDDRFDEEDLPFTIRSYHEQVTGWRLPDDRWLRLVVRISGFPGCGRRIERRLAIVGSAADVSV